MRRPFQCSGLLPATMLAGIFFFTSSQAQIPRSDPAGRSQWVFLNAQGKLTYKTLKNGDRIMDFSHAGYMGGGVALPSPPARVTVSPVAGDNTDAIQKAIYQVSGMPLVDGFRGAVLLSAGTYDCDHPLYINASGVVLRGSGSTAAGTILDMTGKPHTCLIVKGSPTEQVIGSPGTITDAYVPSGTNTFTLDHAAGFQVGDTIRIIRPVTETWVHFMGMDHLVRNNRKQTWITGEISMERIIRTLVSNRVTVDVPLSDSYDARYLDPPGSSVVKVTTAGLPSQIGIENLRIMSRAQSGTINQRHDRAFTISDMIDGWVRNVDIFNTVNSISVGARRITLEKVNITHEIPTTGAAKPADINGSGSQLLVDRCHIKGSNLFFFATGAKVTGPIVLLNCSFQDSGWIQPHQRWATGLLIDHCQVPDGGIDFMNRGEYGSGHGWAIGWAVAWNCTAKSLLNQEPPGAANWVIGCKGERQKKVMPFTSSPLLPEGIYDAYDTPVSPSSLYLAQLKDRLGDQALTHIGY